MPVTSRSPHSSTSVPQPIAGGDRQPAERVAVEVDPLRIGVHEPLAEARERVGGVERGGVLAGQLGSHSTTALHDREFGSRCS